MSKATLCSELVFPLSQGQKPSSRCKICGEDAVLFDVVDFNKFCDEPCIYRLGLSGVPVYYERCQVCGFIFTRHFDDWGTDRFRRVIYNDDYRLVDGNYETVRPKIFAEKFATHMGAFTSEAILDYGSGTSTFATALAEYGFKTVASYDPLSNPKRPQGKFDIISCIEVIEHMPDPIAGLADMKSFLKPDGAILFSTSTQPNDIDIVRCRWWYIAPRNGHVSIHSNESLHRLAEKMGLVFVPGSFHCFAHRADNPFVLGAR
jgi:SAM-dependent methyltransferase